MNLNDLTTKFTPVLSLFKRYAVVIFLIAICSVYGFLTYRINSLTQLEPSPDAVAEKLNAVGRPRIDQEAIDKLSQLEAENIEVQTLFQQARDNPFSE